jgi:hypothetical protein
MRLLRIGLLVFAVSVCARPAAAVPILLDFESLADMEILDTQFAASGLLFSGATALRSGSLGGSLNELEFPPASGDTVIFDSSAAGIRVDFATGASIVSGRFTYTLPVTMTAFAGAVMLGSITSQFDGNTASGPNAPNELLQLAFATPISHVILTGDPVFGGSFTLDDFFADTVDVQTVPEPGTAVLVALGAALLAGRPSRRAVSARPDPPRS